MTVSYKTNTGKTNWRKSAKQRLGADSLSFDPKDAQNVYNIRVAISLDFIGVNKQALHP